MSKLHFHLQALELLGTIGLDFSSHLLPRPVFEAIELLVDIHLGESENSNTTAKTSYVELMEGEKEWMAGQKARTIGQGIYPCTYRNVPVQTLGVEAGNVNMDGTGEWTKCGGGRRFRDGLRHRCFEEELAGRNEGTVAVTFACLMLRACDTGTGDLSIDQNKDVFELNAQW